MSSTTAGAAEEVPTGKHNPLHSSKGRIGVLSFSARLLFASLIMIACSAPLIANVMSLASQSDSTSVANDSLTIPIIALTIICLIGICYGFWISVISAVKRLHDLNLSGWLFLLCLVPVIGVFFYLYVALKPADDSENQFGKVTPASTLEKVAGPVGIVVLLLVTAASIANWVR